MTRAHIILNSRAGGLINGGAESTMRRIKACLDAAGWEVTTAAPEPDTLEHHLRGLDRSLDVVVAAGGDGTIAGVGSALSQRRTALAVLPLGTLNVLAEDLGVPSSLDEALETIVSGERTVMDVASVNGRKFFIQAVLGVAADLAERREKMRGAESVTAWAELATGAASDLLASTPVRFDIRTQRRHAVITTRTLIISNNRLRNRSRLLPYRRSLRGQVLALYALRNRGPLTALRFAARALLPGDSNPLVREIVSKRIVMNADRKGVRAIIDGEIAELDFPATFNIIPGALNVIVPRRSS